MTPAQKAALPGLVSEIERCRVLKAAQTAQERDVFARAKDLKLDGKALRKLIARRAEDPEKREALDDLVAEYEAGLSPGMRAALDAIARGASINGAAETHRVPRANLQRLAPGPETEILGRPPHDPETGKLTEFPELPEASSTAGDGDAGSGSGTIPPPGPASSAAPVQDEAPAVETAASGASVASGPLSTPAAYTPRVAPLAAVAAPAMPPIPTFLRRGVRI